MNDSASAKSNSTETFDAAVVVVENARSTLAIFVDPSYAIIRRTSPAAGPPVILIVAPVYASVFAENVELFKTT